MRLGAKLNLYLALIIILVLSGYGSLHILTRRENLIKRMKVGVWSTGRTLTVALEKISPQEDRDFIQNLVDAISEYDKTLRVVVYYKREDLIFRSHSLGAGGSNYIDLLKKSIEEDSPQEEFGIYNKAPEFSYAFPLRDKMGETLGAISILQNTSLMEKEIKKAEWEIAITILLLIGGTVTLIIFATKKWIAQPVANLMVGTRNLARGDLNYQIELKKGNEFSELAQAFNQMAMDLKKAQERIVCEAEVKLELERSLRQSEKLATIGQLASELAHEIGTPLNIIHGRTILIERNLDDKESLQKTLDIIIRQTERITKIMEHLLGFVRKKPLTQTTVNIVALLESTLDLLEYQIKKQGVTVVKTLTDDLLPLIGDPDQLQQVFLNLILNAIQSMTQGGRLSLSACTKWISKTGLEDSQKYYLEISIEDTGVGMEREVLRSIFDPFFTTKNTGTGLGLMVTQGIVQDHEGWIEVESQVGKGSLFKVYLPCFQKEEQK